MPWWRPWLHGTTHVNQPGLSLALSYHSNWMLCVSTLQVDVADFEDEGRPMLFEVRQQRGYSVLDSYLYGSPTNSSKI